VGMLVFAGLNLGLLHRMLQEFNGVAATATVAGKMRMLGQKLAYEGLTRSDASAEGREGSEHDIVDFEAAYLVLRSGGKTLGEVIRPLTHRHTAAMNAVWLTWKPYRDLIRQLPALSPEVLDPAMMASRHRTLAAASSSLLERTDILIRDLVQEAQAKQ